MRFLREYHLRHHYENGEKAFGVTSPLWDWAFGTLPTHMTQSGKAIKQAKQARTRARLQKSERSTASLMH
jgi:sterol desaturase/sphingolipid hydroxylase (fatty acid hydroxylase superfamily)